MVASESTGVRLDHLDRHDLNFSVTENEPTAYACTLDDRFMFDCISHNFGLFIIIFVRFTIEFSYIIVTVLIIIFRGKGDIFLNSSVRTPLPLGDSQIAVKTI